MFNQLELLFCFVNFWIALLVTNIYFILYLPIFLSKAYPDHLYNVFELGNLDIDLLNYIMLQ